MHIEYNVRLLIADAVGAYNRQIGLIRLSAELKYQ